jgi:pimeloyl-ACP methyl ester carboxylesterase
VNTRNLIRIAVAVAALGYLAYAYLNKPGATAHALLAAPIPAHATEFTLGTLQFKSCELAQKKSGATTAAFCAPFQVPENWDAPEGGRKIDLKVALMKSHAQAADIDVVVFLAGGPGQAATEAYPNVSATFAPLLKHHHVLLLDQRGTGGSNPLTCKREKAVTQEHFDLETMRTQTRACLQEVSKHADPRYYTTAMALRDLDALRQALGAPPFDLIGGSYGTRVAQQFVARYPNAVRSMVLDSSAPNELVLGEEFAANLDSALKAQFAACSAATACAEALGDPWANLLKLRDALRLKPVQVDYRDPVDFSVKTLHLDAYSLATLARMYAYTPETSALLPLTVAAALQGDYLPMAAQGQLLGGELESLSDNAMQLSVLCSEDADLLTARPQEADTILGTQLIDVAQAQCAIWPHGSRPADFHIPIKSDKPALVLAGELDPVTPPRYGEQVLAGLSDARLLLAKGQGHSVMARGCFPKLIETFVEKLNPKTLDAGCLADLGPTPAFVDFNGSSP